MFLFFSGDDTPDERIEEVRYLLGFGEDGICILNGAKYVIEWNFSRLMCCN